MKTITSTGEVVDGLEAIREWFNAALSTFRGKAGWQHPDFGVDWFRIIRSTTPEVYIERNIQELCKLRGDILSCQVNTHRSGGGVEAYVTIRTSYGNINLTKEFKEEYL